MSLATVLTRAQWGVEAPLVHVEVHLGSGLPAFQLVGLAETAVRESRERVRAALQMSGFDFPAGRLTVNLAPADVPKEGGRFDLPLALGVLAASGQLPPESLTATEFYGELSLEGELRPTHSLLVAAARAAQAGHRVVVPSNCLSQVSCVPGVVAAGAAHLRAVVDHLAGREPLAFREGSPPAARGAPPPDLAEVQGQTLARWALEVAAAGGHSLLLVGPPGAGKSLLADRLIGLLPPLTDEEALESAIIAAAAGCSSHPYGQRPFRAPHHTATAVALVGGGQPPRPGEVTLAHRGVLFLDELTEFGRAVLEVLREPLENRRITVARGRWQVLFPADCQLVAAMNPCPCGYHGDDRRCRCGPGEVRRYLGRISGPFLDRIDLQVFLPQETTLAAANPAPEGSATVRERVVAARARQHARGWLNAQLPLAQLPATAPMTPAAAALLEEGLRRRKLSMRAQHRTLRVARTLADLAGSDRLEATHLSQALGLRQLEAMLTASLPP